MWTGRVNNLRHCRNDLLDFRITIDGVFPDLPGVGGQIDLGVAVVVEDAVLLGVQVADQTVVVIAVVVEEGFVGADDFGVLDQALPDASAQPDETLDAIGIPEDCRIIAPVILGYPLSIPDPPEREAPDILRIVS